ncbi:twin-arginine translocase TatA/TatE family subunit [Cohnella sp. LGH]|uniref:Sec-independent protein translocase protein TatA n=1 Tax=Cohnella phaseoli TaxID=456490 RepID=A0A3D9KQT0_9BACL|nr:MULTISPECIES: twin-arginine translocase TatA/TatE family subunit [Cohnella]QTH43856.1 twin-arginine translocase TatA/TatE family subunit [Cohnella sp. LGH]RED89053.1 sec-independent protein translocase protein TatA [Cohnella phaseoli]
MAGIGTTGLIIIIFVALLLFGPSKLPELGKAFGRTLKEFKNGAKDLASDNELKSESKEIPQIEK